MDKIRLQLAIILYLLFIGSLIILKPKHIYKKSDVFIWNGSRIIYITHIYVCVINLYILSYSYYLFHHLHIFCLPLFTGFPENTGKSMEHPYFLKENMPFQRVWKATTLTVTHPTQDRDPSRGAGRLSSAPSPPITCSPLMALCTGTTHCFGTGRTRSVSISIIGVGHNHHCAMERLAILCHRMFLPICPP